MRTHERIILAHHLVLTLYGHWPPNDLRGSGSRDFYDEKFAPLGPIYHGRKPKHMQPSRSALREYHRKVEPLLNFPRFWIDDATRQVVAGAIGEAVRRNRYTCYACAICSNHVHMVIRKHRDRYEEMFANITNATRQAIAGRRVGGMEISEHHPVFSQRPYSVFLYTPEDIRGRIRYVEENPVKEGSARQVFDFVTTYDGWPFAKGRRGGDATPQA